MFNSSGITESTSMNFSLLLESQTPEKDVWIISLGNNQTRPWQLRMEYIRDTTGDPDSQQPPRSSSIRICICICSKNVILTSVMFWLLTYSVLRIRLSSSLAEMTFLGQETKRKRHKHIPVYMRYVRFNGCLCALWPFYRSYTINCHTNPHNLASRILWWVSGLSVLTPPSICLFKESKQASKERKTSRTIALDSGWQKSRKFATNSNTTQACYKSHKSPSPCSGLIQASEGGELAWLRPKRLWGRLIDHLSLA